MVSNWLVEGRQLRNINIKRMMGVRTEPSQAKSFVPGLPPNPATLVAHPYQSNDEISKQFNLNAKQDKAYMLVANTLEAEIKNESKFPSEKSAPIAQLRLYIGGPGGTGKSRVVDALKCLFKSRGKLAWLQCAAPTGTAAKSIKGRTFFSLLGIDPKIRSKQKTQTIKTKGPKRDQTAAELKALKFLIIDEVSMIPCNLLQQISSHLINMRGADPNCDFGGVHVIFLGDFYQLRPCSGRALYVSSAEKSDWPETIQGRKLWTRVNKVVLLSQQHRQGADKPFAELLQRIRNGKVNCCCHGQKAAPVNCSLKNPCDYHTLLSRVISADDADKIRSDPEWNRCKIVVPQNLIRQAWNHDDAASFAKQSKQPLLICTAVDFQSKAILSKNVKKRLSQLKDNETASLPFRLPLVVGLRVMLRYNLATELGLTNGAEGTIVEVVLDPKESIPQALIDEAALGEHPVIYNLKYQPKRVIVEFDHLDMPKPFSGMKALNHVPIQLMTFGYSWTPPTKKGNERAKPWPIRRRQLPLIPTRAFTIHMAQGRTFGKFIADIHQQTTIANGVYVALSRGQCLKHLHILQPFHHSVLHCKPDLQLQMEIKRLQLIEETTVGSTTVMDDANKNQESQQFSADVGSSTSNESCSLMEDEVPVELQSSSTPVHNDSFSRSRKCKLVHLDFLFVQRLSLCLQH